jgi:hypothetical protein
MSCSSVVVSIASHWSRFDAFRKKALPFVEALHGVDAIYIQLELEHWQMSDMSIQNLSSKTFVFPHDQTKLGNLMSTVELVHDLDACIVILSEDVLYRDMNTVLHLRNMSAMFPENAIGFGCEEPWPDWRTITIAVNAFPFLEALTFKGTNVYYKPWHALYNRIEICPGWLSGWLGVLYKRKHFHAVDAGHFFKRGRGESCMTNEDILASGYLRHYKVQRLVFTQQRVKPVLLHEQNPFPTKWRCARSMGFF